MNTKALLFYAKKEITKCSIDCKDYIIEMLKNVLHILIFVSDILLVLLLVVYVFIGIVLILPHFLIEILATIFRTTIDFNRNLDKNFDGFFEWGVNNNIFTKHNATVLLCLILKFELYNNYKIKTLSMRKNILILWIEIFYIVVTIFWQKTIINYVIQFVWYIIIAVSLYFIRYNFVKRTIEIEQELEEIEKKIMV